MAKTNRPDAMKAAGRLEGLLAELGAEAMSPDVDPAGAAVTVGTEGGPRGMFYAHTDGDLTVGAEASLSSRSALRGVLPASPEGLQLLGALTLQLSPRGTSAHLLSDSEGLTGVLLTRRLCGHVADSKAVDETRKELSELAVDLASSLAEIDTANVIAILGRFRPDIQIGDFQTVDERPPVIPTFDEQQRDRMMAEA